VGQLNLSDSLDGTIDFASPEGKSYALGEDLATIVVRPRGWHLPEKHIVVDGAPMSGDPGRLRSLLLPLRPATDRRG